MANYADKMTDKQLIQLEKEISLQYSRAAKELDAKSKAYFKQFETKRKAQEQLLKDGKISQNDFDQWCITQMGRGQRWEALRDQMASKMADTNEIVAAYVNDKTPGIYSLNRNFAAYTIEQTSPSISFTLVDERTVKELMEQHNHVEFKVLRPNKQRDYAWSKKKIQNALTQGILQGDSISHLADRYMDVMKANRSAAIRNARTAVTSAQNAGRQNAYESAHMMGIEILKEWVATLDDRTRDSHQLLDGIRVQYDKLFPNGLEYPGDTKGDPGEVYNCRCTMVAIIPGVNDNHDVERAYKDEFGHREYDQDGNPLSALGVSYKGNDYTLSYEDWLAGKKWNDEPLFKAKDELNSLQYKQKKIDAEYKAFTQNSYDGIWRGKTVTEADWESVKDSIPKKEQYYLDQIAKYNAAGDTVHAQYMQDQLDKLHKFDEQGKIYYQLKNTKTDLDTLVKDKLTEIRMLGGYDPWADPYSQERKDAAIWAKDTLEADKHLRGVCGDVWQNASRAERTAIYDYTWTYSPYNEPLRGIEYGTSVYKGVGNTSLNKGNRGDSINLMTDIINKSSYTEDIWLQRGCGFNGMDKFLGIDSSVLRYGDQTQLENELLGKVVTEYGFMSCGVAKGKGFSGDIIMNVYAPAGTNMMYAEPFSRYGNGSGSSWDGKTPQSSFGSESEIILQQGTEFRITKVEKTPYMIYLDIEVVGRKEEQRWQK